MVGRVGSQYRRVLESKGLPEDLRERYNRFSSDLGKAEAIECSLVNRASGSYPGHSFGHIIHVPNFGKIILARLKVSHGQYDTPTGSSEDNECSPHDGGLGAWLRSRWQRVDRMRAGQRDDLPVGTATLQAARSSAQTLASSSGPGMGQSRRNGANWVRFLWLPLLFLLFLLPFEDTRPQMAQVAYDHAWYLIQHGDLIGGQQEAALGYQRFQLPIRYGLQSSNCCSPRPCFTGECTTLHSTISLPITIRGTRRVQFRNWQSKGLRLRANNACP